MVTYAQDNVIDEVVWVVGDEAILKSDVEEARMDALYNGRRFEGDPYCVIPEEIAVQKLFLHQAKLDSIEVSEAEIIQRVDMMTNMYIQQIGSKEKMEEYFNKTATQIRETLRENARDGLTVQKMQQKLVGDIKVTPAEVRRYFKDLPQDSIPYIPTQVEVQIITLQPKIPIAEIEDVKRRLRDYTDRVTKGEIDFSTLARLYSEDKASAIKGGELDFVAQTLKTHIRYLIEVKAGKGTASTALKALEQGKANKLLYLKGDTKGGTVGNVQTLPIYLLEQYHF